MPSKKSSKQRPTDAELEILRTLWDTGPATVRDVHAHLHPRGDTGYTSTLKFMQIMHQKGLLHRDASSRAHIYKPAIPKEAMQQQLVGDLLHRVFSGSRSQLVLQTLGDGGKTSPEELNRIRKLLDELDLREK